MSTVSPVPGAGAGGVPGSAGPYSQHGSTPSHHHSQHSSSQEGGGAASGLAAHSSFDSVSSHHGHQQQQHGSQQQSQHSSHSSSNAPNGSSSPWGHPQQVQQHYGSSGGSGYPSHGMYSPTGYYGNQSSHSNGSAGNPPSHLGSGGYAAYSVQPHQGQPAHQSMYGSHTMSNNAMNGNGHVASNHHSGSSTPTSITPYSHHPHSFMSGVSSNQAYHPHHQSSGGYYGMHNSAPNSNGMISSSSSYSSAPQYSTQLPVSGRHRVTTTLWEDEGTLCFQVEARGVCVARRHDNNMINGTKLLNVCGMSRGKRDGILKNEKERVVVKVGAMHLKGVWITFQRGRQLAEQNDILDVLYPLFETNIQSFLYHPDNYPRTVAVMKAAEERHAQRSRGPGTGSPGNGYPPPQQQQRASSHSSGPIGSSQSQQQSHPPLMRANTTPGGQLLSSGGGGGPPPSGYHHPNGYSSTPSHSQNHSPYAPSHSVSIREVKEEDIAGDGPVGNGEVTQRVFSYGSGVSQMIGKELNNPAPFHSAYAPYPAAAASVPLKHRNPNIPLNPSRNNGQDYGEEAGTSEYPSWNFHKD